MFVGKSTHVLEVMIASRVQHLEEKKKALRAKQQFLSTIYLLCLHQQKLRAITLKWQTR